MKMEMYVAPELEVLEVVVESGFAGSTLDENSGGGTTGGFEGAPF